MRRKPAVLSSEWLHISVIIFLIAITRLILILRADFPLNDGGLFLSMTQDLIKNNFKIPLYTSYNADSIPYAYPPLAFAITGVLHQWLKIPLIEIIRFLPFITSIGMLPITYLFFKEIIPKRPIATLSLIIFALSPRSFQVLILGGGLTRSIGMIFCIATFLCTIRYLRTDSKKYLMSSGILFGLTLSSHAEVALFTAISLTFFIFFKKPIIHAFAAVMFVAITGLIVSSGWLIQVISHHGLDPYISALQSNPRNVLSLADIALISYIGEPKIQMVFGLSLIGILLLVKKHAFLLPFWILIILITVTRQSATFIILPLSIIMGYAIEELIPFIGVRPLIVRSVFIFFFLLSLGSALTHAFTPFHYLPKSERIAMEWVSAHTAPDARFAVISAPPGWAWFMDTTAEWFPALSNRMSITTVQGYEWKKDFQKRLQENADAKKCNNEDIGCLEQFAKRNSRAYDHIFISKQTLLEPGLPACCALLIPSVHASYTYRLIFENEGALVFAKTDLPSSQTSE